MLETVTITLTTFCREIVGAVVIILTVVVVVTCCYCDDWYHCNDKCLLCWLFYCSGDNVMMMTIDVAMESQWCIKMQSEQRLTINMI